MTPPSLPDYEISRVIGQGGQAVVYLARHRTLEREAAIKVLLPSDNPSMGRRMLQEARLLAALRHPNLVQIYDAGTVSDGTPYLIMEYVNGQPLSRWLHGRDLRTSDALALTRQVAAGLGAAHAAGIIHRDVKMANIMMAEEPDTDGGPFQAKLLDFGVARPEHSEETAVGMLIGTAGYMAPECYEGRVVPASDCFSVGVVLFRMLTGERDLRASQIRKRLQDPGDSPASWSRHPDLVAFLERLVAEAPEARPQDGAALVAALDALAPWDRFDTAPSGITALLQDARGGPSRRRAVVLAAACAAAALAALGALRGTALDAPPDPPPAAEPPVQRASEETPPAPKAPPPADTERSQAIAVLAEDPSAATLGPSAAAPTDSDSASAPDPVPRRPAPRDRSQASATAPAPAPASETAPEPNVEPTAEASVEPTPTPAPPPETEAAPSAQTAPESAAPPPLPTGTYAGTMNGRRVRVALSGSPLHLSVVLDLTLGARTERHTLTGKAIVGPSGWAFAAREADGPWVLQATLQGGRLGGTVSVRGRDRGRLTAEKQP